ncbi:MAG: RodZ domain-containing protein [Pseudomonadota bacterium]
MSAEWADQPVPDNQGIPGKTLAAQREAMGWTVEQVADQLKLAVRQVVALEQGDYANLPGPAVVRGFIRAYAKVVKLDAAPLVAQIALETPAPSDATSTTVRRDKPASFSQVRFPTNGKRASKFPLGLTLIAIVLAGAAGAAWHFGVTPESLMGRVADAKAPAAPDKLALPTVTQDKPVAADPAAVAKPAEELPPVISNSVPLISVPPPTPAASAPGAGAMAGIAPTVVAPAAPKPANAPVAAQAAPAPDALVLVVREDSWVEVRTAKGRALFSSLVKAGNTETINVTEPVTLIVGKPSAVDATLRGAALALPTAPGVRVARVNIK